LGNASIIYSEDHLGDLDVDGRMIYKMDIKETSSEAAKWIQLAQDVVHWRALVKTLMNLCVP
jgi:hypothetical protein